MSLYSQPLLDLHEKMCGDLFAGGGGASSGFEQATGRPMDFAINHDAAAVALHKANHPQTAHHVSDVFEVDPRIVCGGRPLGFLWASPDCFPAGTLVLTREGYVPIEMISVGDEVFTHKLRWRRVTTTMVSSKLVQKVTGHGHPGLLVSQEHPFLIRNQDNRWNNDRRAYDRHLGPAQWLKPDDWNREHSPMNTAGGSRSYWASPAQFPRTMIPRVSGRGMDLDADLMWLAGRYLGDGWTRLTDTRAELVIICGKHEADALGKRLNELWPRVGARAGENELAWHRRDLGTAVQFTTNHRGLVVWLRSHFGHGAGEKTVPAWAFGLDEALRAALLEGYCSADGCDAGTWQSIQTVSKSLAFGVRTLATTLGYVVTVHLARPQKDVIEGRKVHVRQAWIVKWRHATVRQTTVLDEGFRWSPVKTRDSVGNATVYNLSVEEDESYVVEGIVVHNCTYHSKARGGKPIRHKNQKRRALAWVVTRWAGQVQPDVIMLENVEEFADWGGLHAKRDRRKITPAEWAKFNFGTGPKPDAGTGRVVLNDGTIAKKGERTPVEDQCLVPNPKHRSKSFRNWVKSLERHGYVVEWRELRACDYGAPTIRKRLFVIARRDGKPIVWPEPTHAAPCQECRGSGKVKRKKCAACFGEGGTGGLKPFRTAAECIDWTHPMLSIFATRDEAKAWGEYHGLATPQRPLAENTMRRIARGVQRYVIDNPRPYIVSVANSKTTGRGPNVWDAADPLRTLTQTNPFGIVSPVVAGVGGRAGQSPERDAEQPFGTITAKADAAIVAPIIAPITHGNLERRTPAADEPLATITCAQRGEQALVAPVMVQRYGERPGQEPRARSIEAPAATVVNTGNGDSLVAGSLISYHDEQGGQARAKGLGDPIETVDCANRHGLVSALLVQQNGGFYDERGGSGRDLDQPNGTVCAEGSPQSLVTANLTTFRTGATGQELDKPGPTVTANSHDSEGSRPGGAAPIGLMSVHLETNNNSRDPYYGADEPTHTKVADGAAHALVGASLAKLHGTSTDADPVEPLDTIAANGQHHALVASHIQRDFGQSVGHEADVPIGTLTADRNGHAALVSTFLQKFYGTGTGQPVDEPAHTIPTVDRFGLVTVTIAGQTYVISDIAMRMLQPRELYMAQGFRSGYIIDQGPDGRKLTKSEQVRMCGNSVSPPVAEALVKANVPELIVRRQAA